MLNKQRRVRPLFAKAVAAGERMVQRALRRRRGHLHRRSRLHPALGLPVAVGQAHRRSAEGRSGRRDRQQLRRLRQLRRGGRGGGALPVVLPRRHHPQPDRRGIACVDAAARARSSAAAARREARPDRLRRDEGARAMNAHRGRSTPSRHRAADLDRHPRHGRAGRRRAGRLDRRRSPRSQGWAAQSTSVPGVAQRTGATIYYVEMLPPTRRASRRSCR